MSRVRIPFPACNTERAALRPPSPFSHGLRLVRWTEGRRAAGAAWAGPAGLDGQDVEVLVLDDSGVGAVGLGDADLVGGSAVRAVVLGRGEVGRAADLGDGGRLGLRRRVAGERRLAVPERAAGA